MTPSFEPRRYPPRFTIRTVLLVVLISALGSALFVTTRELRVLRKQNIELRAEAGYLTIKDPDKVAFRTIPQLDDLTWRWRIHLPKGRWLMHAAVRNIPQKGFPEPIPGTPVFDSGPTRTNTSITISIRKDGDGQRQLMAQFDEGGGIRRPLNPGHALLAAWVTEFDAAGAEEETFDPDDEVILMRIRAATKGAGVRPATLPPTPCDGLMVWLERQRK